MRIVLKGIKIVFLLWLGLTLWNVFSPSFLPGPATPPGSSASVQQALEGLARARLEGGPEAEQAYREHLENSRPFDNYMVIYYVLPILLVWLLCAIGKARQLSPIAIFSALALLWIATFVVVQAIVVIAPHTGMIGSYVYTGLTYLSQKSLWQLGALALVLVVLFIVRTPGFIFSVLFYAPRQLDRAMVELLNNEDGWLARRHGSEAAQLGHGVLVFLVTGIFGWVLWRACDGIDGGGIPDTFALVARGCAVAYGAFLLVRTHLRTAM